LVIPLEDKNGLRRTAFVPLPAEAVGLLCLIMVSLQNHFFTSGQKDPGSAKLRRLKKSAYFLVVVAPNREFFSGFGFSKPIPSLQKNCGSF
jgi:hypothetical protein